MNNILLTDNEINAFLEELQDRLIQETAEFVIGIAREGERAAVVLGSARLDVSLERLLKKLMQPHVGGSDNLFDSDRPLGSFSAKIALAYRLGVIDRTLEHALQMIRKIRNAFAHSITVANLADPPYNGQFNELIRDLRKNGNSFDNMVLTFKELGLSENVLFFLCRCSCVVVEARNI